MSLLLNFSPIEFTDTEVEAGVFPYGVDGERVLKQLRQQNWATHVFRREGPDQIIAVPVAANAQTLGESTKKIRLKENLGLTASLIRNSIINFLAGLPRTVLGYDPIRFIAQDDILRSCLPSDLTCPDWLGVRLLYEIAIRPIYFFKHEPFIAAVLNVRTTRILERTVADLLADGLSPAGHYVAKRVSKYRTRELLCIPNLSERSRPLPVPRLLLLIQKMTSGLSMRMKFGLKKAFSTCVSHAFQGKSQAITSALEKARADLRSGPTKLQRINNVVDFFASRQHLLAPGIPFKFSPLLNNTSKGLFPKLEFAPKPTYVFDQTGAKTDTWNDRGLNQYGPYTAKVFTPNRPRLCVVCQKTHKGRVE